MASISRVIEASPDRVWEVLADGWLHPLWVVGATRMRAVDDEWPAEGSALHHSVGVWPVTINDDTVVLEVEVPRRMRLQAKGWPAGEAEVILTLEPEGVHTNVSMEERVTAGPGRLMPPPIEGALLRWRNRESLRRLALVVEGRTAPCPADGDVGVAGG